MDRPNCNAIFTAVIVAGGKSSRYGSDKALSYIAGRPMISWVASSLRAVFTDTIVAGGDLESLCALGLKCFPDPIPSRGVLSGLYTGFMNTNSSHIFLCGCDMPLIIPQAIRIVLNHAQRDSIVIPKIGGIRQPLHAVYSRHLLPLVEKLLLEPDFFLPDLFECTGHCLIDEEEFAGIPDYQQSFVSLNDHQLAKQYEPLVKAQAERSR